MKKEKKIDEHHNAAIIIFDSMPKCIVHHIAAVFLKAQAACARCLIAIGSRLTNFREADHTSLFCPEQGKWEWKSARGCFIFRQVTQALSSSPSLCSQRQWLGGWLPEPLSFLVCNHKLPAGSPHSPSWLD